MNRIQFWILTALSSLLLVLLIAHIVLLRLAGGAQAQFAQDQQFVNQAQGAQANLKQLAVRIFQDSQKTGDQGLKDLLTRQQITYTPNSDTSTNAEAPASTPATH